MASTGILWPAPCTHTWFYGERGKALEAAECSVLRASYETEMKVHFLIVDASCDELHFFLKLVHPACSRLGRLWSEDHTSGDHGDSCPCCLVCTVCFFISFVHIFVLKRSLSFHQPGCQVFKSLLSGSKLRTKVPIGLLFFWFGRVSLERSLEPGFLWAWSKGSHGSNPSSSE